MADKNFRRFLRKRLRTMQRSGSCLTVESPLADDGADQLTGSIRPVLERARQLAAFGLRERVREMLAAALDYTWESWLKEQRRPDLPGIRCPAGETGTCGVDKR